MAKKKGTSDRAILLQAIAKALKESEGDCCCGHAECDNGPGAWVLLELAHYPDTVQSVLSTELGEP